MSNNLIEQIERGDFDNLGHPEKTIDTLLSKVFFFGERVIKVYKHQESFLGNMNDFEFRRSFYTNDFFWNHAMSPNIYLELNGVIYKGGGFIKSSIDEAEDFYIVMKKIDTSMSLTNLLLEQRVGIENIEKLTETLLDRLTQLTKEKQLDLQNHFNKGWLRIQLDELEDLRRWLYLADKEIQKNEADRIVNLMISIIEKEADDQPSLDKSLWVAIDNNCDNLLIIDSQPSFIDIYPPKENWQVSDILSIIARTSADAYALGGSAFGDAVYRIYEKKYCIPSEKIKIIAELRGALIQWAYRYMLSQKDIAIKYKDFVYMRLSQIGSET